MKTAMARFTFLFLASAVAPLRCCNAALTCGLGTFLNVDGDTCMCNDESEGRTLLVEENSPDEQVAVNVAGLVDITNFDWGEEIFDFTASLINNHTDGWHDDVLDDGTVLGWTVADSACDGTIAARAYWDLRTENGGRPMHGIVGCRCSSASIAVARIAGLEGVPQVSPSSTSSRLSNVEEFPYFSRTISPDEASGLVSMLRLFGWDRVGILKTDTQFANDLSNEFFSLWVGEHSDGGEFWEGEVVYSHTISLNSDQTVDYDSVLQALDEVPTDNPSINAKVVMLFAHSQHAYSVLKIATETVFQPDTIWVGPEPTSWTNRPPPDDDLSWLPSFPGYLGLTPYRNRNADYQDYLQRLNLAQIQKGREPWENLPDYAAEYMIDALLAIAMALSSVPHALRQDGALVTSHLRHLTFNGVSGPVSFTEEGDRQDPRFTIFNLQKQGGEFAWVDIGSVGTAVDVAALNEAGISGLCFAEVGCDLTALPSDKYPVPRNTLAAWVIAVITIILVLLLLVTCKYWQTHQKKKVLKSSMTEMQRKMEAMKNIDSELLNIDQQVEAAKKRQASLILKRFQLQEKPDTWSETSKTIVLVPPEDEQYWTVLDRMRETMPDAHISKLWRVQNTSLWSYYSFHKDRLAMHGIGHNEQSVWHGTSTLDPSVIYSDRQDGFMMQFAAEGLWGRGIYFAKKAAYSYDYAYKCSQGWLAPGSDERLGGERGEREMFLTKLLVGNATKMKSDRSLTVPPTDPKTNLKYNTVTGETNGSQVWIVYENGRAYPDYLVRYYRGERDVQRSPYTSRQAMRSESSKTLGKGTLQPVSALDVEMGLSGGDASASVTWEYLDNSGWKPYSPSHQLEIENFFLSNANKNTNVPSKIQIKTNEWQYEVDVHTMVQTNIEHSGARKRSVRRNAQ